MAYTRLVLAIRSYAPIHGTQAADAVGPFKIGKPVPIASPSAVLVQDCDVRISTLFRIFTHHPPPPLPKKKEREKGEVKVLPVACCARRGRYGCLILIGARNLMLCPIDAFRTTSRSSSGGRIPTRPRWSLSSTRSPSASSCSTAT